MVVGAVEGRSGTCAAWTILTVVWTSSTNRWPFRSGSLPNEDWVPFVVSINLSKRRPTNSLKGPSCLGRIHDFTIAFVLHTTPVFHYLPLILHHSLFFYVYYLIAKNTSRISFLYMYSCRLFLVFCCNIYMYTMCVSFLLTVANLYWAFLPSCTILITNNVVLTSRVNVS